MIARLVRMVRRAIGRALVRAGERLLHDPHLLAELRGDDLTRAGLLWNFDRAFDASFRARMLHKMRSIP